jgi:hypothetical protein
MKRLALDCEIQITFAIGLPSVSGPNGHVRILVLHTVSQDLVLDGSKPTGARDWLLDGEPSLLVIADDQRGYSMLQVS